MTDYQKSFISASDVKKLQSYIDRITALKEENKTENSDKTCLLYTSIAVAVIASVLTRPQYVLLLQCDTTKEASEVSDLLDEQGLDYRCV